MATFTKEQKEQVREALLSIPIPKTVGQKLRYTRIVWKSALQTTRDIWLERLPVVKLDNVTPAGRTASGIITPT